MKVSTVSELLKMDDGDQPKAIKVKLNAVWKRRTGDAGGRAFSFEDCEFMDASGKIKGKLVNREAIPKDFIGQMIYLEAAKSSKGWSGLYVIDEKWTPKDSDEEVVTRKLKVTATAIMTLAEDKEKEQASDNDGDNVEAEPEDDLKYGSDEENEKAERKAAKNESMEKVRQAKVAHREQNEAKPEPKNGSATNCRCKEVHYERVSNLGNYCSERVGITLELEPGAKFQDCLDLARQLVESNLKPEEVTKQTRSV